MFKQRPYRPLLSLWILLLLVLPAKVSQAASVRLITDPEVMALIQAMGKPLVKSAGLNPERVKFFVILDNSINAFALANQYVVFNSGLILKAKHYDEIAGVIAHELGHLKAGHHIKLKADARTALAKQVVGAALGIAAGVAGSGEGASAFLIGSNAIARQGLLDSSRVKEQQADRLAVDYMIRAAMDPEGVSRFFKTLYQLQRMNPVPPAYLSTHPLGLERLHAGQDLIDRLRENMGAFPTHERVQWQHQLKRIQAKLEASASKDLLTFLRQQRLKLRRMLPGTPEHFAVRYGIALGMRYAGQLEKAEEGMRLLLKENPNDPYLMRELGLVVLDHGRPEEAIILFRQAVARAGQHPDMHYRLAFALHEAGQFDEAANILYRLTSQYIEQNAPLYLLGVVEGKRGNLGMSHTALARYERRRLKTKRALWHYRQALKHLPVKDALRNRIKVEIKAAKEEAKKYKK
ncbi:M48 family metalloprotease [Magnetococcus sp. PR-3]|uniref:M48 family metalloprotease n=1 Tax=Magnetococcus sp. PR-3 TaxID=3120355 RepID=UPI002FCE4B85